METIKKIYNQYKEILLYLIFGVLTTGINIISYYLLTRYFQIDAYFSNIIAWVLSVLFAFFTNKTYVFESSEKGKKFYLELISFFSFRLLSLVIDMGSMYLMISILYWNDMLAKILTNGIVIILNYIFSKFIIFKKIKETKIYS